MPTRSRIDRRHFVRRSLLASASVLVKPAWGFAGDGPGSEGRPRVVHVHHGRAVTWPQSSGLYRDYVGQDAVRLMLDEAVRRLKGGTLDAAWRAVFRLSSNETRRLAIKVNANNATDPTNGAGNVIDALPEPVIAVIKGFLRAGGRATNCTVYDLTSSGGARYLAPWFRNRVLAACPGVAFGDAGTNKGGAYGARTHVTWSTGYAVPPPVTRIHDVVLQADYVVNVPVVKRHIGAGSTLGYKNHFGSIENCSKLHDYVYQDVANASALVDVLGSPVLAGDPTVRSLAQKTVLTVGDLLYGQPCKNFGLAPVPWTTFRREWPSALVVSDDPVAADSVMLDLLEAEPAGGTCGEIPTWARHHLSVAQSRGQGVYDHVALPVGQAFDPAHMTYAKIEYAWLDLWPGGADLKVKKNPDRTVRLEWTHYFNGPCNVVRATRHDFSDAQVVATTVARSWTDTSTLKPLFYRIDYAG